MKKEVVTSFDAELFTQHLSKLTSFKTVTGQLEGFDEAMNFIQKQLSPEAHVQILPNNGEPILIASNRETKTPDVCFLVHVDVVAAKPHQFSMQVKDGVAYGRGVSDMKYSIPLGYALLNQLIKDNSELSFMFVVTSDEERGGFKGAGFLADTYQLKPKLLIVPDGGDNFVLINKSKGVCHLRIRKEGKPAHASRPWLGENALVPVIEVANQLIQTYKSANTTEGWHTTVNIGKLVGGESINQVASSAHLDLDFRFPPEDDSVESLTRKVIELCNQIDPELTVEVLATGSAPFTDIAHPALALFSKILTQKLEREIQVEGGYGSHDGRHLVDVPFIMTKPEGGDIHGDAEHINIQSVLLYYEIVLQFLQEYESTIKK